MRRYLRFAVAMPICGMILGIVLAGPANAALYAINGFGGSFGLDLQRIDPASGAVESSMAITGAAALQNLTADAGGNLYAIGNLGPNTGAGIFRIDPASANATLIGEMSLNVTDFAFLEFNPVDGVLYRGGNDLLAVDPLTGDATFVASITGANLNQRTALAIDGNGNAYLADASVGGGPELFRLNLQTGAASLVGTLFVGSPNNIIDLAFDEDALYGSWGSNSDVYAIDVSDAATTFAFATTSNRGLAFVETADQGAVPEPSTLTLLGLGVVGLAAAAHALRRRG